MRFRHLLQTFLACAVVLRASSAPAQVIISEFLAANATGIVDDTGTRSDWLELYNAGTSPVNLDGYYLTDDPDRPNRWQFPQGMAPLAPNSYLLVWASGQNKTNPAAPLHTSFKLAREGGYLALLAPGGHLVSGFNHYPPQSSDVSYGRDRADLNAVGFFRYPTPGSPNVNGLPGPSFSHASGIYTNATISVAMSSAGGYLYYTLDGTVPTTNSVPYAGPITIGTNVTIKARVFPASLAGELPSEVVSRNFVFLDDTTAEFNSNLPLLIISTEGKPIPLEVPSGGDRTKGSLSVLDVKNARSSPKNTPDLQVLAGFEFFGQTAIGFPKKPIRVETQDAHGNDLKVSILGLPPGSDYRLRNPYNDKTFLNDFLSTELYEQMSQYSVRRRFVEAFVDTGGGRLNYATDYYGVMVLFEGIQIDQTRLDIARIPVNATNEPAITGGYVFKKDKDSQGDLNFTTTGANGFPPLALKMHDPKPNDLRLTPITGPLTAGGTAQVNYLRRYLSAMEQAMYAPNWLTATGTNHYSHYLDVDSFVDLHWMTEFAKYVDGHRISTFFYKDRGGKVSAGPIWGWNLGFGNANFMLAGQTNGWYYEQIGAAEHGWMRRLIEGVPGGGSNFIGDPDFVQKVADRWGELRTNIFHPNKVLPRIDELATYLSDAALRDFSEYPRLGQYMWAQPDGGVATGGSAGSIDGRDVDFVRPLVYHDGTVNSIIGQMKKFIHGRYLWIDSQFTPPPVIHAPGGVVTNGFSVTILAKPGAQISYTLDGSDPRGLKGATNGLLYTGPIVVNGNVRIVARARELNTWKNTWSGPSEAILYTAVPSLRITEIMYHPAAPDGTPALDSDFEFIEVRNIGNASLNVNGCSLAGGVQFQFPDITLSAGQSAVVVKNFAAFQARYGFANPGILILGKFSGELSDAGETIVLKGPIGEPILNFAYQDAWYPTTDGLGFSLTVKDPHAPANFWGLASHWRPSSQAGGSPGQTDPPPAIPRVLMSEVLANPGSGADAIEVFNDSDAPVDLGGWFLSDDFGTPKKYLIPSNTIVAAHGFYVFYETNSFNFATNGPTSFGLAAQGDDVWIFSGDGTNLTGYAHGHKFGASPVGHTFGRHLLSTEAEHFVLQAANSLGSLNSPPAVGPIVITEINAQPPKIGVNGLPYENTGDEYIELRNIRATNVALYSASAPANTWQVQGSVAFHFPPTNVVIPPGGSLLLVGFDPALDPVATAAFRERNGAPAELPIFGPWAGRLNDTNGILELVQPDVSAGNGTVTPLVLERVSYSSDVPWPTGWAGSGLTLQKISPTGYSDDPVHWAVLPRTPGTLGTPTGTPPAITSQPHTQVVPTGRNLNLSVTATGTALGYQWQRNGLNLPGATNSILVISNFQVQHTGPYNILVYNSAGSALGEEFTLSARTGLQFVQPPTDQITTNGGTTSFSVAAVGSGPVRYQWKLNGTNVQATNVLGADSPTLTILNAQPSNEGSYTVSISDDWENALSQPVTLTLIYQPVFTLHPLSQQVVQGGSVTLSAAASGTTPMTFRWRKQTGQFTFTNLGTVTGTSNSFFTITNFQPSDATNYNVVVSNLLGFALGGPIHGVSASAALTLLIDTDGDGLSDAWETGREGFSPTDPADATRDDDGDGMNNRDEFIAGTDHKDRQSYLKVNINSSGATISFLAVSNRTYSVLYWDALGSSVTQKLSDLLAYPSNSVRTVLDPNPGTNRFYRITTPLKP